MEATQRKKFVCKFCNKRYPCGKSLGGHIRIHLNGNGNSSSGNLDHEAKFNTSNISVVHSKKEFPLEVDANSQPPGYGLRENPKKTKRFSVDANNSKLLAENVCKECGKGFQSLKALCGHMACHSKNNTSSFDDYSGTSEKLKEAVTDGQSDTETSNPSKGRRSKRLMRYKTVGVYSSSLSLQNGSLSSASDVEQEQEEVAMSLMMLSRDSGFKGCFSFVADSSDNNSVVVEAKSYSTKMRISVKNGGNFVFNGKELLEMKKSKQRELVAIVNDDHSDDDDDNSDSGYFRNEPKKVKSEVFVHGFTGNHHQFKKHKAEFGMKLEDEDEEFDAELGKKLSSFRRIKAPPGRDSIEEDGYDPTDGASMKCYYSRKKIKDEVCSSEFRSSSAQKRAKYVSLDEHRSNHRRSNRCIDSVYESGENSIDNDEYRGDPFPRRTKLQSSGNNAEKKLGSKKRKVHECPFCSKVFQSGQALGGHKRSHFVGVGGDRTLVINQEVPEIPMPALIDLNLPAPAEEDVPGYMPW